MTLHRSLHLSGPHFPSFEAEEVGPSDLDREILCYSVQMAKAPMQLWDPLEVEKMFGRRFLGSAINSGPMEIAGQSSQVEMVHLPLGC